MKCLYCKGDIETMETNYIADLGKCIIVVRNVLTQVCRQCGEKSYSYDVSLRLQKSLTVSADWFRALPR